MKVETLIEIIGADFIPVSPTVSGNFAEQDGRRRHTEVCQGIQQSDAEFSPIDDIRSKIIRAARGAALLRLFQKFHKVHLVLNRGGRRSAEIGAGADRAFYFDQAELAA